MRKAIPILLWAGVILTFSFFAYGRYQQLRVVNENDGSSLDPPGRFLDDIPWKHFADVPPFEMIDQRGQPFDSRTLAGQPYLLNFFFAQCPASCRDLNAQMAAINEQLRKEDLRFLSITIDPKNDSPEVLKRYAQDYDAQPERWFFLTDQMYKITELGEHVFEVLIGNDPQAHTHTEDILLVDKWGRFRDRFRWNDPVDMKRLLAVVKDVCAELKPPLEQKFRTRNVVAGHPPANVNQRRWIRDFHLTDQAGAEFYSRDLTGNLWLAYFFDIPESATSTAAKTSEDAVLAVEDSDSTTTEMIAGIKAIGQQNLDDPLTIVGISVDPLRDTQAVLQQFHQAQSLPENWRLLTGDGQLIERIGSEFFSVQATAEMYSNRIFVIDRWHRIRGSFGLSGDQQQKMSELIESLLSENLVAPTPLPKPNPAPLTISNEN